MLSAPWRAPARFCARLYERASASPILSGGKSPTVAQPGARYFPYLVIFPRPFYIFNVLYLTTGVCPGLCKVIFYRLQQK